MRKIIAIAFVFCFALISCYDFDASEIENLNDGEVLKIGHAGLGFHRWYPFNPLPSNSFKSVLSALEDFNSDGVEVDVQLSADNVFVLYHDRELNTKTNLKGCIAQKNWDELKTAKYKLGYPFDWFQNEKLITLDSLIDTIKRREVFPYLHLDLRTHSTCFNAKENSEFKFRFIHELHSFLNEKEVPEDRIFLIASDREVVSEVQAINSPYPIAYEITHKFSEGLEWAEDNGMQTIIVKRKLLTAEKTKRAHDKGIEIVTFSAKSKSGNRELLMLNPDMVQTDSIDALDELLTN